MRCACGKPLPISGRRDTCIACYYAQRVARAVGRVWELKTQHDIEHVREKGNIHRWIYRGVVSQPSLFDLTGAA